MIKARHFSKGEVIFREGDDAEYFYGIIQGSVSIRIKCSEVIHIDKNTYNECAESHSKQTSDQLNCVFKQGDNNTIIKEFEIIKLILDEGNCFGEKALLYNTRRANSVYAEENCSLFFINKKNFNALFKVSNKLNF